MQTTTFETVKQKIERAEATCILFDDSKLLYAKSLPRLTPILELYHSGRLQGKYLGDRVIGKAAASFLICGGIAYVYGHIMSEPAHALLCQHNIRHEYHTLVPAIQNQQGTGLCPMERLTLPLKTAEEAVQAVLEVLQ